MAVGRGVGASKWPYGQGGQGWPPHCAGKISLLIIHNFVEV